MRTALEKFARDDRGGVAVWTALTMTANLMVVGAAISYTLASSIRTSYQRALDSAVLAAAVLPTSATEAERKAAAEAAFQGALSQQARDATPSRTPPNFKIVNSGASDVKITGQATAGVANPFGGFIGGKTVEIGVSAAAQKADSDPICVLALNKTEQGAFDLNGTVNVTTNCPAQANSQDSSAVRAVGNPQMNTAVFAVTGEVKGRSAFSPRPETRAPRVPDPLASLPFPTKGACHARSGERIKDNTTLTPGTYCGGLDISSGAVVMLQPGIYIFTSSSGAKNCDFKISAGAKATGDEVLLAFSDCKFWMTGGAAMKVTSPKSGPYMNMQFVEDTSIEGGNHWVSIGGDSNLDYDGTMYFPSSNIWIFGGSVVKGKSPNLIMVGDKIWYQDNSVIELTQANTRGLTGLKETPRLKIGAMLVQ